MSNLFSKICWRKFVPSKNKTISISVFHCSISTNITFYYFIFGCVWLIFFKVVHILLTTIIVRYVFLIFIFFFCRTKLFKFQIYCTNFFFPYWNYHDNQNSPQNYNIILTIIKIKLKSLKIENIIIYYSNNL